MIKDKVVVVTGGAGLLGKSLTEGIVQNGGTAIIADYNESKSQHVVNELAIRYGPNKVFFNRLDITSKDQILDLIEGLNTRFNRIDAVINNAYPRNSNYGRHFFDIEYNDFCENINLHLGGYFLIAQQFAKFFMSQGYGNIVNIASIYGVVPPKFEIYRDSQMTMPLEYAAIKSGVIHITKYVAKYLKESRIRVNCVSPGGILDNQPTAFIQRYKQNCSTKGLLNPDDIKDTVVFLLSEKSKYINGQNIIVDDGFTL